MKRFPFSLFLVLPLLMALAACRKDNATAQTPVPDPKKEEPAPDPGLANIAVSADSLMKDVMVLSADSLAGRKPGTDGHRRAETYLLKRLEQVGLQPVNGSFRHTFPLSGGQGINLLGQIKGQDTSRVLVLSAHYDHLGTSGSSIYHGADDNASGVAALLAAARWFSAHPPRHTLIFAFFDAEEKGLLGAKAFVNNPPVAKSRIALNVNLDMVSRNNTEIYASGTHHYSFLKKYLDTAAAGAAVTLRFGHDLPGTGSDDWTTQSDHYPFHQASLPFVYFGVEDHPDYHKPTDTPEKINRSFFAGSVGLIIRSLTVLDRNLNRVAERR